MKKLLCVILLSLITTFAFAQYTVTELRGRCFIETSINVWAPLQVGDVLTDDSFIKTEFLSFINMTRNSNGERVSIRANSVGLVMDVLQSGRISQNVTITDTRPAQRTTGSASTAAARASDQASELDIAEE